MKVLWNPECHLEDSDCLAVIWRNDEMQALRRALCSASSYGRVAEKKYWGELLAKLDMRANLH